jgi:protein SCO1/2
MLPLIFCIVILCGHFAFASTSLTPDWSKVSGRKLPDVVFTDGLDQQVRLADYNNKVVILHPMFTHCPSTCLLMSSRLSAAIEGLSSVERERLRVLSFSFDPAEKIEDLKKFENIFHVDRKIWKIVRAKPQMIQELLDALDFRTLQLSAANFEHANLVFVIGTDRVVRDYILGSDLTADRLKKAIQLNDISYSGVLTLKSYIYVFAGIGLLISTFIAAQQLMKSHP